MKNINSNSKKRLPAWAIAVICVAAAAVAVTAGFIAVKKSVDKKDEKEVGYSFSAKGFENIGSIKSLNQEMLVFTEKPGGKAGLMTLGGEITEKAVHTSFSVCSDTWGSFRYVAETPFSEYLLLVDTATKTVGNRQYHGLKTPEMLPCWSEAGNHLAWTDEKGYKGEIRAGELDVTEGLYPVAGSLGADAKWGFFNAALQLEVPLIYEKTLDFSGGVAPAKKDGKWGYVGKNGATAIPFDFDSCTAADVMGEDVIFGFRNGLAPVCKGGKFGVINLKGETVVDFSFDSILPGDSGVFVALRNGEWGKITVAENLISEETTTEALSDDGEAVAQGTYKVKTAGSVLNLRKTASAESAIIGKIPNGTELNVTKSVSGWAFVTYNSAQGWVSSDFLVKTETTTENTTAN